MEPPKTNSVEAAFRPAFEEISRRSGVAQSYTDTHTSYFPHSTDSVSVPFLGTEQQFVLVSMGTSILAPRPEDTTRPALRIYGAFGSRDEAIEHSQVIRVLDQTCSLVIVKQGEWVLMPQEEHLLKDVNANRERCEQKLAVHRQKQEEARDKFYRRVNDQVDIGPPSSRCDEDHEWKKELEEAERLVYHPPKRLRTGGEVRGQAVVALCVVTDADGECLFKVLGCFENNLEADRWVQNVASRKIVEDDIFVTSTCEWTFPNGEKKQQGSNHYRNNELQRIMDAADRNPEMVQSYKDWKKSQEEEEKKSQEKTNDDTEGVKQDKEETQVVNNDGK
jgi:hypothetical protein